MFPLLLLSGESSSFSQELNISNEILSLIEDDNFPDYLDPVYLIGHIRSYAKFLQLNEEEIILQRKNKFLQIGRGRGFSTKSDMSNSLSLKKNNIEVLFDKIIINKKILGGIILLIITILAVYLFNN